MEATTLQDHIGLIIFVTIAFLTVMWGSFYFFVQFKKKEDIKLQKFIEPKPLSAPQRGPDTSSHNESNPS